MLVATFVVRRERKARSKIQIRWSKDFYVGEEVQRAREEINKNVTSLFNIVKERIDGRHSTTMRSLEKLSAAKNKFATMIQDKPEIQEIFKECFGDEIEESSAAAGAGPNKRRR
jgi:hypothetical protein